MGAETQCSYQDHTGIVDRIPVAKIKKFVKAIQNHNDSILWAVESDGTNGGITALLPGVWTGRELVPHVEITGLMPTFSSRKYRKVFQRSLSEFIHMVPDTCAIIVREYESVYQYRGNLYPFISFTTENPEEPVQKKELRNRSLVIRIPVEYWEYRAAIIERMLTRERRTAMSEKQKPQKPAAVPANSVTDKPDESGSGVKPAAPVKPAPTPAKEESQEQSSPKGGAPAPPFANKPADPPENPVQSSSEEQQNKDECVICGGSGEDPAGNTCQPCNGTGSISKSQEGKSKGKTKPQAKKKEKENGESESQADTSGSESQEVSSGNESTGEETGSKTENTSGDESTGKSTGSKTENSSGGNGTKPRKKKRSKEEVRRDTIAEVESWGYKVVSEDRPASLEEAADYIDKHIQQIQDHLSAVKGFDTAVSVPDDREDQKNLVEKILPDDSDERMKFLGELMARKQ